MKSLLVIGLLLGAVTAQPPTSVVNRGSPAVTPVATSTSTTATTTTAAATTNNTGSGATTSTRTQAQINWTNNATS